MGLLKYKKAFLVGTPDCKSTAALDFYKGYFACVCAEAVGTQLYGHNVIDGKSK